MRSVLSSLVVGVVVVSAPLAARADRSDDIIQQYDRLWPNVDDATLDKMDRELKDLHRDRAGLFEKTPAEEHLERCTRDVRDKIRNALDQLSDGVNYLHQDGSYSAGSSASNTFDGIRHDLQQAKKEWRAGTPQSCSERELRWRGNLAGTDVDLTLDTWIEKADQLVGLATQMSKTHNSPSDADIRAMPRATASSTGAIPAKWVDNAQFGCGSLTAWMKTVTDMNPAGDVKQLPGCTDLSGEDPGPAVALLSKAKQLVAKIDYYDKDAPCKDLYADNIREYLGKLDRALQDPMWRSSELDPVAGSFERLSLWEKNQLAARDTRCEIVNRIAGFYSRWDAKKKKFLDNNYDVYQSYAQVCLDDVKKAEAAGVDVARTYTPPSGGMVPAMTFKDARDLCQQALGGMKAKAKAVAEAAAAEDKKWKTLCGGDKYRLWTQPGEFALARGGWDQSRPEQACSATVWWSHHGPDNNAVYDCDKYTFSGSKLVSHTSKSNRWYQVCPQ